MKSFLKTIDRDRSGYFLAFANLIAAIWFCFIMLSCAKEKPKEPQHHSPIYYVTKTNHGIDTIAVEYSTRGAGMILVDSLHFKK